MIDADKRKAVFLLHQEGMGGREIARRLGLGRNTVRRIIALGGRDAAGDAAREAARGPRTAAAALRRVRGVDPAGAREAGGGRRRDACRIRP